jgi:hypothetical protein
MKLLSDPVMLRLVNQENPVTIPLNHTLSVRLYSDCRPHCMETAALQKGLVLMRDGKELIEEGMGFGVPIAKYTDKTYFASTAKVSTQNNIIRKTYFLDTISKKTWRGSYIDDLIYSNWRKKFAKIYLSHKELLPLFNRLMEYRELAKIRTEFVRVKPRGTVNVEYRVEEKNVAVSVDFSNLTLKACEELLVLNEQGASFFDTYKDAGGLKLVGGKIGGWHQVVAKQAFLENNKIPLAFRLSRTREAALFRGWEKTKNRFSWAGLSYSLLPNNGTFTYSIDIV